MRIHRLEVEGFRSLKKVSWEPGALNVVIGPNGSGKSNLLKHLELIRSFSFGNLNKQIQKQGGFNEVTWNKENYQISFNTCFDFSEDKNRSPYILCHHIVLTALPTFIGHKIDTESLSLIERDTNAIQNILFQRDYAQLSVYDGDELKEMPSSFLDMCESFIATESHPKPLLNNNFLINDFLKNIRIYTSLDTSNNSPIRSPFIPGYELHVDPDGNNLTQTLHNIYENNFEVKNDIDAAMNAVFGDMYVRLAFPPASDNRLQLKIYWKNLDHGQSAASISDGTLRFLYLLAILANPDPSPLIAIDEPETGLHPSMFPIIAEFAAEASKKSQIIFTTHSDQFLTACGEFDPTITVASWSEGETHLKVVNKEELKDWLKQYSLGALFRSGELEELA